MNKQTNKLIPELRFPEFVNEGEWEEKKLGDMTIKVGSGVTPLGGESNYKKTGHPLTNCKICNKELRLIDRFFCKYCGKWHCKTHRLPENHHCHNPIRPPGLEQPNPGWNKYYD